MNAGDALLAAGVAAAVLAAALAPLAARVPRWGRAADRALLAAALAFGAALAWLALHFLAGWTDLGYVWAHTWTGYPWFYRLAGVWGGQEGTVVLWAALVAAAAAFENARAARLETAAPLRRGVAALLAALAAALGATALVESPFAPTEAALLALRPEGQGLVEVLVTPLMVVHPPVQFLAYAAIAVPAAAALAGLWTGERGWVAVATRWARPAWMLATLGLGLGAVWAYYVLSFGGFWAWDPVETANLLPWLALTGFLHARRAGAARLGAPLFAVLALVLVVFATLSTRSGLWVSVHAFTDPADRFDPDAAARFVAILEAHAPSAAFAGLLAALLALAAVAFGRALARERPGHVPWLRAHAAVAALVAGFAVAAPAATWGALLEAGRAVGFGRTALGFGLVLGAVAGAPPLALYLAAPERKGAGAWLATRPLLLASAALLGLSLVVALALDLAVVNGATRAPFDARAPLLAIPLLGLVALAFGHRLLGRAGALAAVGAALAGGVALALLTPWPWPLAAGAPVAALALALAFARGVQALAGDASRAEVAAGALLLAGAVAGVVWGANPPHVVFGRPTSFALGAVWIALALLGVLGGVAALTGRARALAWAGAAGVALAVGYGVGLACAAVAAALLARAPAPRGRRAWRPALGTAGVHLAHVALVLALLGYGGATYASDGDEVLLAPGDRAVVGGVALELVRVEGVPFGDGTWREVVAVVALNGGEEARLRFDWRGDPINHYEPVLEVRRGWWRDVYLAPEAFHVEGLGVLRAHEAPSLGDWPTFAPENVRAVAFQAEVLPLMPLVWGGLWLMLAAMALVVAGAARGTGDGER